MEQGEIFYNGYDGFYTYREPFGDSFRETCFDSDCNDPNPNSPLVWQFLRNALAFAGWKYRCLIYSQTIREWYVKGKTLPMTPEERERVIKSVTKHFKNKATRVIVIEE